MKTLDFFSFQDLLSLTLSLSKEQDKKKQEGTEKKGKTEDQKKAFTAAKKKFMERANSKDGFNRPLNFADAVGSGGNKDNGNMAKRFLSFEQRENVIDLYEPFDSLSEGDEVRKII